MILDTSIIVALALNEAAVPWIQRTLAAYPEEPLRMSWVNATETVIILKRARAPAADALQAILLDQEVELLGPDFQSIYIAAQARLDHPINFGDCFAYAHAQILGEPLLTLDADFLKTDLPRVLHPEA